MQFFIIVVTALLLRFSESKTSPLKQLRGSLFLDDIHEHHEDEHHDRLLQKKCGGDIKTTLFKGNITMQSLLRPLQCTAAALVDIGIVLDLVFDDVVKGNKVLSSVNLNTTVCTTPTISAGTGNYQNRRLAARSNPKYTYRAGKCMEVNWLVNNKIASQLFGMWQVEVAASVIQTTPMTELANCSNCQLCQALTLICHCECCYYLLSSLVPLQMCLRL